MSEEGSSNDTSELQAQLDSVKAENANLRKEAASRRVSSNQYQKQAHVLQTVLNRHNINFDMAAYDMDAHTISDGKVQGEVAYDAVKPKAPKAPVTQQNDKGSQLTFDDLKTMSREQIMKRWDDVSAALDNANKAN